LGYVYNYTDHLGSSRVSYQDADLDGNPEILEENNYYPFGLKHEGYNELSEVLNLMAGDGSSNSLPYKYKYNGKEFQYEPGLNMYDYGWRNYDSALGRWMNIDNMAEKYVSASPYHYAGNNPVLNLDVDGNEFTESAWQWVNRLIADINSRQEKNNKSIADYQSRISVGGSDRQIAT
jgi:RHS repeat-associated protein